MLDQAVNSNYLFYLDFVSPRLRRRALLLAGGCEYTADELLAEAADVFAQNHSYLGDAQAVKYGKLCLLQAARGAGLMGRKGQTARRHREASLEQLWEAGWDQEAEGRDLDADLDRQARAALLDRAVHSWGCPQLKAYWAATKAGLERQEAREVAGLTDVQVSRLIDFLATKLGGRPRGKNKGRGDDHQMGLFELGWQGV
ncbi:hypothetical protein [Trichlorobacter lovleyi]|uniref:hypothetical protein n=1 Tax=Trichlorobacter lovleyi TaxID=313985 RepID=UPI0024815296|nr:hypothetical protein [Trichlorobacter lovleyi]